MPKEPQSYGSQGDWLGGNVGEEVNRQKGRPNSQHADFYQNRRDSETSAPHQGGEVSDLQVIDDVPDVCAPPVDEDLAAKKVTDQDGGAKRGGFFKKRDY